MFSYYVLIPQTFAKRNKISGKPREGEKGWKEMNTLSIVTKNEPHYFPSLEHAFKPEEISENLIYWLQRIILIRDIVAHDTRNKIKSA